MAGLARSSDADVSEGHSESETGSRPKKKKTKRTKIAIKEKIEKLKEIEPQKQFFWELDEGKDEMTARNELWTEVVKKVRVPKIDQTKLAIKGDKSALRIITADIDTYKALKDIVSNRENVRRIQTRKPMVMFYDIDRDLTVEEIKDLIKTQNQELNTGKKELEITPLFRRRPSDSPTV